MYTSPDEARSDLFLSAAVYVIGPAVIAALLSVIPIASIPGVGTALLLIVPFITTALVPILLIRYRKEGWASYGLTPSGRSAALGLLALAPLALVSLAIAVLFPEFGALPFAGPAQGVAPAALALGLASRLITWVSLGFLGVYATVKARDAFRANYTTVPEGIVYFGRWLALAAAIATVLLLVSPNTGPAALRLLYILTPVGVAVAVALVYQAIRSGQKQSGGQRGHGGRGQVSTTRATMLTAAAIFGVGAFSGAGLGRSGAVALVLSVQRVAEFAALGLIVAAIVETRRSAAGVFVLCGGIALFVGLL